MKNKKIGLLRLSALLVPIAALVLPSCIKTKEKPNIIFILADDMGWADLPVYGNKFNEAPNLEKFASEGMQFMNAYAACPVCSPTRASIMSGQYPARVGVIDFIPGHWRPFEEVTVPKNRTQYLPLEIETIGESIKKAGYATGYIGKWHLGDTEALHPSKQGFDKAYRYAGGGFYHQVFSPAYESTPPGRLSGQITDFGLQFIEENKDNPFFLFLAHYDVHVQLDADSALIEKYLHKEKVSDYPCNAVYAGMIEHVDNSVGRVMQKLKELDLEDNTIVIFFSDNGGLISRYDKVPLIANSKQHFYEGDSLLYIASSNKPLRGEKGTVYEGGIREPMIVRWPGKIKAGAKSEALVSSVDFYPTLLELAGGSLPESQILDGQSLVPVLLKDKYDPERAIFWHYPVYHHMEPASAVRKGDWKLIQILTDQHKELYNLANDIGETKDVSSEFPEITEELSLLLDQWRKEVKAELPVKNPNFDPEKRFKWDRHPDRAL